LTCVQIKTADFFLGFTFFVFFNGFVLDGFINVPPVNSDTENLCNDKFMGTIWGGLTKISGVNEKLNSH